MWGSRVGEKAVAVSTRHAAGRGGKARRPLTPTGIQPTTEDDGCIYVLPLDAGLDLAGELTCDRRDGDVW